MWQTLGCNVHKAAAVSVLREHAKPLAVKASVVGQRLASTRRPLIVRAPQRQICAMSYAQAYQDPVATQRSNRVYTHFAVSTKSIGAVLWPYPALELLS